MYMLGCIKWGYYVRGGSKHFYRRCCENVFGRLRIAEDDFVAYLNLSFNANMTYAPNWCFREIYKWVQRRIPSIKPLAGVLESIIYLNVLMAKRRICTRKLQLVNFMVECLIFRLPKEIINKL